MKENEIVKAFFSNEETFYSFEVWPDFDKKAFDEAFNYEMNNFRLISVVNNKCQIIFETTDKYDMLDAIDNIDGYIKSK